MLAVFHYVVFIIPLICCIILTLGGWPTVNLQLVSKVQPVVQKPAFSAFSRKAAETETRSKSFHAASFRVRVDKQCSGFSSGALNALLSGLVGLIDLAPQAVRPAVSASALCSVTHSDPLTDGVYVCLCPHTHILG